MRVHDVLLNDIYELRNRVVGKKTVEDMMLDGVLSRSLTEIIDLRARRDDLLRSNNKFEECARTAERCNKLQAETINRLTKQVADLLMDGNTPIIARPLEEYHEDMGDVLWWKFPITEPPYVGSPLDLGFSVAIQSEIMAGTATESGIHVLSETRQVNVGGWPGYHTHFTTIPLPVAPEK